MSKIKEGSSASVSEQRIFPPPLSTGLQLFLDLCSDVYR